MAFPNYLSTRLLSLTLWAGRYQHFSLIDPHQVFPLKRRLDPGVDDVRSAMLVVMDKFGNIDWTTVNTQEMTAQCHGGVESVTVSCFFRGENQFLAIPDSRIEMRGKLYSPQSGRCEEFEAGLY